MTGLTAYRAASDESTSDESTSYAAAPAILFIASMATLVQSYVLIKLTFLSLFLVTAALMLALGRPLRIHPRLVVFYLVLAAAGLVWALIGLLHGANHPTGVFDAVRLYSVWSLAFLLLYTLIRGEDSLRVFHGAMVLAGIVVSLMNLGGLVDQFFGWGFVTESMRQELDQYIELHDGFIQITSQNIGTMFLVVPFLMAMELRADAFPQRRIVPRVALALSLILVVVSGRRALWLTVALVPAVVLVFAVLTRSLSRLTRRARLALGCYAMAGVAVCVALPLIPRDLAQSGSIQHVLNAFSAQDERTIQKAFLVEGYAEAPAFGSGFGAAARYLRSYERPWAGYELTYHQMLFNLGSVGMAIVGGLFLGYFGFVIRVLRRFPEGSSVPFALVVGLTSLLIGTYSNRYFGSFDLLFFAGILPLLSTFEHGFARPSPRRSTVA